MRLGPTDVLLALLGSPAEPVGGTELLERLSGAGVEATASKLLVVALKLESAGYLTVARDGGYRFGLTPAGETEAYAAGAGEQIEALLIMADLVGYVAFTELHGDDAARRRSLVLAQVAERELSSNGGRLVKVTGDGVLGVLPSDADPVPVLRGVRFACAAQDEHAWDMRAAAHRGRPISHGGDIYGLDVNIVARMCDAAEPNELVVTVPSATPGAESLTIRGLSAPTSVTRKSLA